ncbi:SLC13 family permease [Microbacterium marinilacus]|uniref:Citrate transporter-like domain-containing protein n=1 Tax=Microbacterium marinilacus TaxID=415209 RepID=A0ABP7BPF5_9MICO|nr:SLC13 family permease [Microbacterium marinilacus]MBY0690437.1 SLC13 family permease [Microbacterium marinilacus]
MYELVATLVILGLAIVAFATNRLPLAIVSCGVALALFGAGVLTLTEALAGFGDPTPVFIATLFIVSEALDQSGVTAWAARRVTGLAGTRRGRITVVVSLMVAVLTAFISINGAVAALLPIVVVVAVKAGVAPSKLLIPLAFAAHAGSLLTLTGTPVNVIVSDAAVAAGGRAFGFFEFALVGLPLLALTVAIVVAFGGRLLPDRRGRTLDLATDPGEHAVRLRESYDVSIDTGTMFTSDAGVVEVVIPPRSVYIGRRVYPGMTTVREDLVILSVRSSARSSSGSERASAEEPGSDPAAGRGWTLRAGDAVLVQGPWDALERYVSQPDVVAVTAPRSLRRGIPLGHGARRALTILLAMVVLLATGLVPPVVAGMLAAGALVLTRVVSIGDAFRSVQWSTVVLIAGMIPLATTFVKTGAAELIADGMLATVGATDPHLVLLALCVLTVLLGQVTSNVATVLVMLPIATSLAATLDVSVQPFMMALTVAGAAAFFTPIATPVNTMVVDPGGYRFGDYWRLGLPLTIVWLAAAVLYVPLIWPF